MDIRFGAPTAGGRSGYDRLADHARGRLHCRLLDRSDRVAHISVRIGGNGVCRSVPDTYCVMQVQLRGAPSATVAHIGADAFDTIDRATDRIARLVEEQLRVAPRRRLPSGPGAEVAA